MTMNYIQDYLCENAAEFSEISRNFVYCTKKFRIPPKVKNHFRVHPSQNAFMQGLFHSKPYNK
jgi:hypothetical protein